MLVPAALLLAVAGLTFGLAEAHFAKPGVPKASAGSAIELGDQYRGQTIFSQTCAACHGPNGGGGGVGPKLDGDRIPLSLVVARIEQGNGVMPAGLVKGQQEKDVLAFVATIIATPPGGESP